MEAYWVIGIVMAVGLNAQPQNCSVNVYVKTGFPLPPAASLPSARLKVTQMFSQIGVNVRMRKGLPARDPGDGCGAPIVVQLEASDSYVSHSGDLAYAMPYKGSGTCIHVFIDRISLHLNGETTHWEDLLAHVIAHEITHVLENIGRHSREGLMKGVWSEDDYRSMKLHPLPFAPEDVLLIREGLAARLAASRRDGTSTPVLPSTAIGAPR